jgi:YebC/PmpR family DNA-binding regulatory protein
MSGHSKWENIKHKKGAEDKKRGQVFGKLAKAITIAVKEGGSSDPDANPRLRVAVAKARAASMPKENIERAVVRGDKKNSGLEEFFLEGYGPEGIAVMVEVLTDNRQRTVQAVKNIFARFGGSVAEPGSVAFQFERRGEVVLEGVSDEEVLKFMTNDVLDFHQSRKSATFYLPPDKIESFKKLCESQSKEPVCWQVVMVAKSPMKLEKGSSKIDDFLNQFDENEDVSRVFTNLELASKR